MRNKSKINFFLCPFFIFLFLVSGTVHAEKLVNINTASSAELEQLTGIGPSRAQAIIDHRNQHGPFKSVDSLIHVRGIGQSVLSNIRNSITVGEGSGDSDSTARNIPEERPVRPAQASGDDGFDLDLTVDDRDQRTERVSPGHAHVHVSKRPEIKAGTDSSGGKININTADQETLTSLPGIGDARAQAIIGHRTAHGLFRTPEQITDVSGIGPAILNNIKPMITVQIDINTAGLQELEAIGLNPESAETLLLWRRENGPFSSIEQITGIPGFGQGALESLRPFIMVKQ